MDGGTLAGDLQTAIDRALGGERLTVDEAETLVCATGADLEHLLDASARLRDEGLARAGRPGVITFSKKVFLPITTLCRDRCHYCIFVDTPGKLATKGKPLYMSPEQILDVARLGASMGCKEALFTLGDRPEDRWPDARAWLDEHGYESTLHYVREMAQLVLDETGLLPHLNPGVMTAEELAWLRPVAPSMGMMLETTSHRLWAEKGEVHFGSPDKNPAVRLRVLEDAGRARVPLTTGLLVGIGETVRERAESLVALRDIHDRFGHLQEIIVQNFRSKPATAMQNDDDLGVLEYAATVAAARLVMGADARIQVPPNLSDASELGLLLRAGADDWGGVSPLTADHVNPERPWPQIVELAELTRREGFRLTERLTVHPPYIRDADQWIDAAVRPRVDALVDLSTMLADEGARAIPRRAPDDLLSAPADDGAQPALQSTRSDWPARGRTVAVHTSPVRAALSRAASSPAALTDREYADLMGAESDDLDALAGLANDLRRYTVGEAISFVVNRNVTSTNLTSTDLPWTDRGDAPDRSALTFETLAELVDDAWVLGATELCVQGLITEALPADSYLQLARVVKATRPQLHVHAFRPADIADGAARLGLDDTDYLAALREAGVDTVPGTGVKILDDAVRLRVAPGDLPVDRWIAIITAAHRAGFRSTSVMVYGNGESAADRVGHLRRLIELQRSTGGFTEFVPMPAIGLRAGPAGRESDEHRRVHAVARLMLHGHIDHIQAPWTRLGFAEAALMLQSGADDLGGTLFDGRVLPEAGVEYGHELLPADVDRIAHALSRPVRQRTTTYGDPTDERKRAVRR
ncbi:7,8-didemethyl-8-hydroxy-5-deazariboflavin synthase CofG [Diaminobutyricibacter tongyongensis]|uniref:7,8-didemethyl-8-hydroxy-5-deazariboflavin synthase n=1 Tax=Leifsonia tongyongensis TaxID=1268043 RepID=A0A6L9XUG6_9MICO|nr:7,8-didemethyl-8-hydroxy-5-deazariboflavin synthase CofG [Diaminobutyricibacter tongyongensis]NEN05040.1 7,8-didemethyl-8-hydroxy-5-deazariboflavin synthase CofG [Diaminobutyricibacter tongyongensis]